MRGNMPAFQGAPSNSGWTALPLTAGWSNYGGGFNACQYRRVDDLVYLRGLALRSGSTAGALTSLGTIPTGYRTSGGQVFSTIANIGAGETVVGLYVAADGSISVSTASIAAGGYVYLNAMWSVL